MNGELEVITVDLIRTVRSFMADLGAISCKIRWNA